MLKKTLSITLVILLLFSLTACGQPAAPAQTEAETTQPVDTFPYPEIKETLTWDAINAFLASLPQKNRMVFLRRYLYLSPIKEIAADYSMTEGNVKVMLHRTRQSFKAFLEKEGIEL